LKQLKFKDVRLRRILKRIDQGLGTLIANENAAQIILIYVTLLPPNEMADFVSYCQEEVIPCDQGQSLPRQRVDLQDICQGVRQGV
jgi:hypothetical protein